ncbi:MAG: hypothetical protein A2Y33_15665 [Spirochaetes bacterium GWF1_51_8]|nr:MAG: hypothetical protein A2Y33_15665 [Spirochaetes bacterium GWF1_51_8]
MNFRSHVTIVIAAILSLVLSQCGGSNQSGNILKPDQDATNTSAACVTNCSIFSYKPQSGIVKSVSITGDFLKWSKKGKPLTYNSNSQKWIISLSLNPGVYQYVYIINGTNYTHDPEALANVPDKNYGQVSIIEVSEP